MEFVLAFIVGGLVACALWRPPEDDWKYVPPPSDGVPRVSRAFHLQHQANIERATQRHA